MDVAEVSHLAMRRDDSYAPPRPDIRFETQPLQNSDRARRAAALDLVGGVLGLFQQRRVQRAELLALRRV